MVINENGTHSARRDIDVGPDSYPGDETRGLIDL